MGHTNPVRGEQLEVTESDDGLVVFDPATEFVHHLNPTAAVIFDLCDGSRDVEAIASILAAAFDLDQLPTQDTLAGLTDLAERKLIRWEAHGTAS